MGIVTDTSKKAAKYQIDVFHEVVVTRENVRRLKPDSEDITTTLEILREKKFVFVGNSSYDHLAAKNAGGHSITIKRNKTKILIDFFLHF